MTTATKSAPIPSRRVTLGDLTNDLAVVAEWLDENDDLIRENDGVIPDALAELLNRVEGEVSHKIERIGLFIRALDGKKKLAEAEKAALTAEIEFYRARESRFARQIDSLKRYTLGCLMRMGRKKIEGETLDVRVQANSAPSTAVPELDVSVLAALHEEGNPFVTKSVSYGIDTAAVVALYKSAVVAIGPMPDVETPNYPEALAAWEAQVHEILRVEGIPAGVRVTRGYHVRFA